MTFKFVPGHSLINAIGVKVGRVEVLENGRYRVQRLMRRGGLMTMPQEFNEEQYKALVERLARMRGFPTWEGFWKKLKF